MATIRTVSGFVRLEIDSSVLLRSTVSNDTDIIIQFEPGTYNCNASYTYDWKSKQISIEGNSTTLTDCYFTFCGTQNISSLSISDLTFFNYSIAKNITGVFSGSFFSLRSVKYISCTQVNVYSHIPTYVDHCLFSGALNGLGLLIVDRTVASINNTIFEGYPGGTGIYSISDPTFYPNIFLSISTFRSLLTAIFVANNDVYYTNATITITSSSLHLSDTNNGSTALYMSTAVNVHLTVTNTSITGGTAQAFSVFYLTSGPNFITFDTCTMRDISITNPAIFSLGISHATFNRMTVLNLDGSFFQVQSILYWNLASYVNLPSPSTVQIRDSLFFNVSSDSLGVWHLRDSNSYTENCSFVNVQSRLGVIYHLPQQRSFSEFSLRRVSFVNCTCVANGGAVSLSGPFYYVDIRDVSFYNQSAGGAGGSLYINGHTSSVTIYNVTAHNSHSELDGGHFYIQIYPTGLDYGSNESVVVIEQSRLCEGFADNDGGAILLTGHISAVIVRDSMMENNRALSRGGAVNYQSAQGKLNIYNCSITMSSATTGGALFIRGQPDLVNISSIEFIGNSAQSYGGSTHLGSTGKSKIYMYDVSTIGGSALFGGALSVMGDLSDIIMHRQFISACSAQQGGAFYLSPLGNVDTFTLVDSNVTRNRALLYGGTSLISGVDEIVLQRVRMMDNQAGVEGGAFHVTTSDDNVIRLNIDQTAFEKNRAVNGGGISVASGSIVMQAINSSFDRNTADGSGGFMYYQGTSVGTIDITTSSVSNNSASEQGGAIYAMNTILSTSGVTVSNNRASLQGGAIFTQRQTLSTKRRADGYTSINDTYTNNAAKTGGAMYITGDANITMVTFSGNHGDGSDVYAEYGRLHVLQSSMESEGYPLWVGDAGQAQLQDTRLGSVLLSSNSSVQISGASQASQISCPTDQRLIVDGDISSCKPIIVNVTSAPVVQPPSNGKVIGIAVGICVGFLILAVIIITFFVYRRYRQQRKELEAAKHSNSFNMEDLTKVDLGEAKRCLLDFDELKDLNSIGNGSFGVVYRATWRQLTVAVKQILSEQVTSEQLKDFLSEVVILQGLRSHPNLVSYIGLTFPPQPLSLVTEFCHGGSLDTYLSKNETPMEVLKSMMKGIALGMNHLHSEGIIHRDLAARNILLTQHLEPKVADFGFSRKTSEGKGVTQNSTGPVRWMAPEAITSREYSTKSDVFSYGVLLWEMVSGGRLPYEDMTPIEAAIAIVNDGARPNIPSHVEEDLVQLISLCWADQPNWRPEFERILEEYLAAVDDMGSPRSVDRPNIVVTSYDTVRDQSSDEEQTPSRKTSRGSHYAPIAKKNRVLGK
ncbi:hypothetical protein PROFUN_03608 [Planoprotostelium fungivorum]|uniref:Protein kinase domain-containing protein n=1 Tax=Planoprotostelium fungivorum TaxID=1890364 RepID=A0A2P6MSM0_9EUKA|nr:hypothetical protein PROFUN_03608 [Planoprotostelium fungivorum]